MADAAGLGTSSTPVGLHEAHVDTYPDDESSTFIGDGFIHYRMDEDPINDELTD